MTSWITPCLISVFLGQAPAKEDRPLPPPFVTVDLNVEETQVVEVPGARKVKVRLLSLEEDRDSQRLAVRKAEVQVEIDDRPAIRIRSGNYELPLAFQGIRIDCPITCGYTTQKPRAVSFPNTWGLQKHVRLRLWPWEGPLLNPGTFLYPAKQRWFASATQMANEPVHVDGGENPLNKSIYYHYGLDIGGAENMVEVVAATDGIVVSSAKNVLAGYEKVKPVKPRYDVVYVKDARGWYYRYSHLASIHPDIQPGARVKMGQLVGMLGKEGASGGWSHLHFDISGPQPSGDYGILDGYAFLWEAYRNQYRPKIQAVARPHHFALVGEKVTLDGSRSWVENGKIQRFHWQFTDGTTAQGETTTRTYTHPGTYSEVLKITGSQGEVDYDFALVYVVHPNKNQLPPTIHASYAPTFGIRPGDPVTFLVRTFRTTEGKETWDWGDGTAKTEVQSDGNVVPLAKDGYARTVHRFEKPGHYLVRVERTNSRGESAIAHLHVRVGE